jgi:hypothetical protein
MHWRQSVRFELSSMERLDTLDGDVRFISHVAKKVSNLYQAAVRGLPYSSRSSSLAA